MLGSSPEFEAFSAVGGIVLMVGLSLWCFFGGPGE